MASANNDTTATDEREEKRLRSSEPDLKVILGSGGDETILWYHSPTLASKSKYIDTMLAVPMRERDDLVITFPDITPEKWKQMLKFLDNPIAVRHMTAKDALEVAELYDRYEFVEGRELCSHIIIDYLRSKSIQVMEKSYYLDLDLIIDLVIVAHKSNMEDTFKEGMKYIWFKLNSIRHGSLMFTEAQLEKLQPVLEYSKENSHRLGLGIISLPTTTKLEEKDFPKHFISECQKEDAHEFLDSCISHVEISGSGSGADRKYEKDLFDLYTPMNEEERVRVPGAKGWWDGQQVSFRVQYWVPDSEYNGTDPTDDEDKFKGWCIIRRIPPTQVDEDDPYPPSVKKICWIAPHSTNFKYPPLRGWIPYDPLARGNPTLKYLLNDSIS